MVLPELGEHGMCGVDKDSTRYSRIFLNRRKLLEYCCGFLPISPVVTEVGVRHGNFSQTLIDILNPSHLYLIDLYNSNDHDTNLFTSDKHLSFVQDRFAVMDNVKILQGISCDVLETFPDNSLDYIYIDADPSYNSVKRDIAVSFRKIRNGGIIQFNNYCNYNIVDKIEYGVETAVNEFIEREKIDIIGLSLDRKGHHDIALRIHKPIVPSVLRARLNIVSPCCRPENLPNMLKSINLDLIEKWYIIYDARHVPFQKIFDHPKIVEMECHEEGVVGHQIRNMALDIIQHGLVYFLDDDNIIHPYFWEVASNFIEGLVYTFDIVHSNGIKRIGDTPFTNFIDTAQYVFDIKLVHTRFDVTDYRSDGHFIKSIVMKDHTKWRYIPKIASYYNYVKWGISN